MARLSSPAAVQRDLQASGYAHLAPELLDPGQLGCTERQVAEFVGSWAELPFDPYMLGSGAGTRRRRYGRVAVADAGLNVLPPAPFVQSDEVNPVFGGIERRFAELAPAMVSSPVLAALVDVVCQCLPPMPVDGQLNLGIHQIRVQASSGADGLPTPEGIHQDGHRFVAQVFIGRDAVDGGLSTFYEQGVPVYQTYLTQPFECLLVDDRRMHHGVSAISPVDGSLGWRDMLLLDFPDSSAREPVAAVAGDEAGALTAG